jgi:sulfotransferase family protein
MKPTVVFILSTPRSGSTWLNLVLGSHSFAANVGEYRRVFTEPGHVVCRLCEANGLPECRFLHGAAEVPLEQAYHFAAERLARPVIVDASKRVEWCARFVDRSDLDVRLIHLVRHPCGFVESEARREPEKTAAQLFADWVAGNRAIEAFCAAHAAPHALFAYDDLADHPAEELPRLCAWLGRSFEPAALRYWEFEHHGLGGNGAASLYLRDRKVTNFVTGDDRHYADLAARPLEADRRWMHALEPALCASFLDHPYTRELRARLPQHLGWQRPAD